MTTTALSIETVMHNVVTTSSNTMLIHDSQYKTHFEY